LPKAPPATREEPPGGPARHHPERPWPPRAGPGRTRGTRSPSSGWAAGNPGVCPRPRIYGASSVPVRRARRSSAWGAPSPVKILSACRQQPRAASTPWVWRRAIPRDCCGPGTTAWRGPGARYPAVPGRSAVQPPIVPRVAALPPPAPPPPPPPRLALFGELCANVARSVSFQRSRIMQQHPKWD